MNDSVKKNASSATSLIKLQISQNRAVPYTVDQKKKESHGFALAGLSPSVLHLKRDSNLHVSLPCSSISLHHFNPTSSLVAQSAHLPSCDILDRPEIKSKEEDHEDEANHVIQERPDQEVAKFRELAAYTRSAETLKRTWKIAATGCEDRDSRLPAGALAAGWSGWISSAGIEREFTDVGGSSGGLRRAGGGLGRVGVGAESEVEIEVLKSEWPTCSAIFINNSLAAAGLASALALPALRGFLELDGAGRPLLGGELGQSPLDESLRDIHEEFVNALPLLGGGHVE